MFKKIVSNIIIAAFMFSTFPAVFAQNVSNAKVAGVVNNSEIPGGALSFCDDAFLGELYTFDVPSEVSFMTLLNNLRYMFGINFLPDSEIADLPVRVNVRDVPWNIVLKRQLEYHGLVAACTGSNTIAITKRSKMAQLENDRRQNAPLRTEYIKLRYLQPSSGGTVNVAGQTSGGSNTFETLEATINKVLRAGGDSRGTIARIPGKAEFIITGTDEQISAIKQVIARADKPSYQVIVYGLIYTANENKTRDIGGQLSVIGGTGNLDILGGISNLGSSNGSGNGNGNGNGNENGSGTLPGQVVPGGVRTFGPGFGTPSQNSTIGGFSAIVGTVQFSAQLSLLAQKGLVKIENRPTILVEDGQTGQLKIGRQVAVPIQQIGFGGAANGSLQILNAANTLQVTPQVVEDLDGRPIGIKLMTQIESNEVDTSVVSQGIPSIQQRSAQSNFQINLGETVILGDFTTDAETNSTSKSPGLGDIPILGNLFKRKVKSMQKDRLFFAIRVEVVPVGETINTAPIELDTQPRIPENDFFRPYNRPTVPVTTTKGPVPAPSPEPAQDFTPVTDNP
jgi:type IV pilus assembly protein PilQ